MKVRVTKMESHLPPTGSSPQTPTAARAGHTKAWTQELHPAPLHGSRDSSTLGHLPLLLRSIGRKLHQKQLGLKHPNVACRGPQWWLTRTATLNSFFFFFTRTFSIFCTVKPVYFLLLLLFSHFKLIKNFSIHRLLSVLC